MPSLKLKCQCGAVQGSATNLTPRNGNRVVCYCQDCQDFAGFLETDMQILDAADGTEICQTSQSQIKINQGSENLRVMKLTSKGLLRWHTSCCQTPIGNSISAAVPFFGLVHNFFDADERETYFGEVQVYCQTQDATAEVDHPKAHPKFPLGLNLRILKQILVWRLQGKHKPSAFFDAAGKPVAEPLVLR